MRVYLACGVTDMRKGMVGLAMLVQQTWQRIRSTARVFAFRGRRAGLIKLIWHDGIGLCMLTKRLEHGQFVWPSASTTGRIALSSAQLAALLDGCEWRAPVPRRRPELAGLESAVDATKSGSDAAALFIMALCRSTSTALPDDPAMLQQMLREVAHRCRRDDKLRLLIQRSDRATQFGRRSEQLTPDQLQFGLEDLEQTAAEHEAAQDAAEQRPATPSRAPTRPDRNHGALPAHLPRYEVVIDVEHHGCPCCGGAMHCIGELRSEQLDIVPAQLRVRVTRRPRYACRTCERRVVVAPAPERPIDGGMATEALIAHVVVSKFCDSLPLYRQSQMLARQGITLDRSTLSNWVGSACWWLTPLYDLLVSTVLSCAEDVCR